MTAMGTGRRSYEDRFPRKIPAGCDAWPVSAHQGIQSLPNVGSHTSNITRGHASRKREPASIRFPHDKGDTH